jgi:hypothetical protein
MPQENLSISYAFTRARYLAGKSGAVVRATGDPMTQ